MTDTILWFNQIGLNDIAVVGGKNASLGEMITQLHQAGVTVPNGFATRAESFRHFLQEAGLTDKINRMLSILDVENVKHLSETGSEIRKAILKADLPLNLEAAIREAYVILSQHNNADFSVAVRSSATAEDLPQASFAGQQETYLNVCGIDNVLQAVKQVFASLFNDRAIAYRVHHGFHHHDVAISAGIQRMVRSDRASSGVMFTLDTESGFDKVVFITGAYGLGEMVVQGAVNPDEFYVYKPNVLADKPAILRRNLGSKQQKMIYAEDEGAAVRIVDVLAEDSQRFCINDRDISELAKQALIIEKHYQRPMDIEWAKDGIDGQLYIVQARPETVKSQVKQRNVIERFRLNKKSDHPLKASGRSIGQRIGQGKACIMKSLADMDELSAGDVLVADMTDPDWEPVMKRASAIVTNRGGRTCHAAIIARELGIPAVVGCQDATETIQSGEKITVSCAEGDEGFVYEGLIPFEIETINIDKMPSLPLKIMMNVGNPERAFDFQQLPNEGVGLARLEFLISQMIGIHPRALLHFDTLDHALQKTIQAKTACYASPVDFYVEKLTEGIASLSAAFWPKTVIVRLSDFKSNEYANLLGGECFEPKEENPMIGFRGASRYVSPQFSDCFALECQAVKNVRDKMGLTNVEIMLPFVRTVAECQQVIGALQHNGLVRRQNGLRVIMMCEIPSNAILAEQFLEYVDGFSIGSNDLTQLTLGLDRDSALVASHFDERNPAVLYLLERAISACKKANKYVGICGQGPSDHPDLAEWLLEKGIDSLSLNPDSVLSTWLLLAKNQQGIKLPVG
ncbi:MAG: phosphoenolpyruvate synthase [Gammaproteobacteria bacterium]|nr:phosphoenolpyruvate synthase [Gammaproteobacteria bacterium]